MNTKPKHISQRGLVLHNGQSTSVHFSIHGQASEYTMIRSTKAEIVKLSDEEFKTTVNELTQQGFFLMYSWGRKLQVCCECAMRYDGDTVHLSANGLFQLAGWHVGWPISVEASGTCLKEASDLLYERFQARCGGGKVSLRDEQGRPISWSMCDSSAVNSF